MKTEKTYYEQRLEDTQIHVEILRAGIATLVKTRIDSKFLEIAGRLLRSAECSVADYQRYIEEERKEREAESKE